MILRNAALTCSDTKPYARPEITLSDGVPDSNSPGHELWTQGAAWTPSRNRCLTTGRVASGGKRLFDAPSDLFRDMFRDVCVRVRPLRSRICCDVKVVDTMVCAGCGRELPPRQAGSGRPALFHDATCRQRARRARLASRHGELLTALTEVDTATSELRRMALSGELDGEDATEAAKAWARAVAEVERLLHPRDPSLGLPPAPARHCDLTPPVQRPSQDDPVAHQTPPHPAQAPLRKPVGSSGAVDPVTESVTDQPPGHGDTSPTAKRSESGRDSSGRARLAQPTPARDEQAGERIVKTVDMAEKIGAGWQLAQRGHDQESGSWLIRYRGITVGVITHTSTFSGRGSWEARPAGSFIRIDPPAGLAASRKNDHAWRTRDLAAAAIAQSHRSQTPTRPRRRRQPPQP